MERIRVRVSGRTVRLRRREESIRKDALVGVCDHGSVVVNYLPVEFFSQFAAVSALLIETIPGICCRNFFEVSFVRPFSSEFVSTLSLAPGM